MAWASMAGSATQAASGTMSAIIGGLSQQKIVKKQLKQQRRIHEESSASRERYSQMARADQDIARQNLLAGESARLNVLSSLGQPGTYGPGPGSTSGPISFTGLQPTGISGIYGGDTGLFATGREVTKTGLVTGEDVKLKRKPAWKQAKPWEVTGVELNPEAMAADVKNTAGFRTVSRMVAEAEQLMNRTGPIWNQLNNSVVGGIYESNAAFQRHAMEQVARSLARGGTARRAGLQMAQAFQVQEQVNRTRTSQLWQAKMSLEEYRTQYAQQVTSYAQGWVNNHAGLRDGFTNALQNLQLFWASTMAPTLAGATTAAQSATQQGILNASQGLLDANNTRTQAISGAMEGLIGAGTEALGSWLNSGTSSGISPSQVDSSGATEYVGG